VVPSGAVPFTPTRTRPISTPARSTCATCSLVLNTIVSGPSGAREGSQV
jgi:hypothetical protein